MARRIRDFLESIVYAGMKPSAPAARPDGMRWLGPLRKPMERLLSGAAPSDPFYLSNRTFAQKLKPWLLIGLPCLIVLAAIGVMLSNVLAPPEPAAVREPTAAEVAAKMLPNVANNIKIDVNKDVEVGEVHVDHSGAAKLAGTMKNNTAHAIAVAEVVFDLTNKEGSQVGAVSGSLENLEAQSTRRFEFPIKQQDASFALVREIRTR